MENGSNEKEYGQITAEQYRTLGDYDKKNNTTILNDLGLEEIDYTDDSLLKEGDILVSSHHIEIYAGEQYDTDKNEMVKMVYSFGHDEDQYVVESAKDVLAQNDPLYSEKKGKETKILRIKSAK